VTATRRYSSRRARLRILVTSTVSSVTLPVPDAIVRVGNGRALSTNNDGVATTTLPLAKARTLHLIASDREYFDGHAAVRLR
jgi:hypothetical protein